MKTKSSPSRYRYCISRLSTVPCSTFSPARKVRSSTAPVRAFLSVVRTKAWPLPGLTCWKSTTWNSPSSRSRCMPFFRSLVEMAMGSSGGERIGRLGGAGQDPAPVVGAHDRVLDPDPAVLGQVDAGLERHDVAGSERSVGGRAHPGGLVDLQPHPVAGAVEEGVAPTGGLGDLLGGATHGLAPGPA